MNNNLINNIRQSDFIIYIINNTPTCVPNSLIFNMKTALALTFVTLFSLLSSKVSAADEDFCTDYVLTSIEQYWQSVNYDCGFTGKRWNSNYRGQYQWCISVYQWVAENENRERAVLLQECQAKKAGFQAESQAQALTYESDETELTLNDAFLRAVYNNDIEKVKQLVKQGADIRFQTDNMLLIQELGLRYQKETPDIKTKTVENVEGKETTSKVIAEPALSLAVAKGLTDVGFWLLEQQQATLSKQQRQHYRSELLGSALITAVKQEKSDLVRDLLNKGASVDYELDGNSGTALYFAVMNGSQKIARLLLERQADPNYTINAGESMLNHAMSDVSLLALLLKYKADPNSNGEATDKALLPIVRAVDTNNTKAVELLMQHGANADVYDYDLPYPLITAIKHERIAIIRILLKHNVNTNVVYNKTSPGQCVEGEKNIAPFNVALETKNKRVMALLAKAKPITEICASIK